MSAIAEPGGGRSTALGGEIAPGELIVSTGDPGDTPAYLVDLKTASMRPLGLKGRPVSHWLTFFGRPNAVPSPGSPSTTLFQTDSGELVRVDPAGGRPTVLLGKPAR